MVDPAHAPTGESELTLEERLRGLAEFGLSPKSRVLEEAADELARLRAENERLRAEREEASQAALDWCVGSLPARYNDLRDRTRAEILGFALYLYARSLIGSVASEKARAEAAEARAERYRMALQIIANTACSPECSCCEMDSDRARRALTEGADK